MITIETHRRALYFFFGVYLLASCTSRSAIEIFSWLTFVLAVPFFLRTMSADDFRSFSKIFPLKILASLFFTVLMGLALNGVGLQQALIAIASQSYMIFFLIWSLIFSKIKFTPKHFIISLLVAGFLALYAIVQTFTGLDLLRLNKPQALSQISDGTINLWRSTGMFHHPMFYSNIAGIHACFAFAFLLLAKPSLFSPRIYSFVAFIFALLLLAIISSFTRGVWYSITIALLLMAYFYEKRIGLKAFSTAAGLFLASIVLSSTIRDRLFSIFDPTYTSNSERLLFWKINWEMFKDHPVFGLGYLQNDSRAREYSARFEDTADVILTHAHSNYLEMLSGTGVAGTSLYLMLIGYMLKLTIDLYRLTDGFWWRVAALGGLGAQIHFHVAGFTDINFRSIPTNHNLMLIWGAVIGGYYVNSRHKLKDHPL